MDVQSNWWESFFQGAAVDLWLQALPPEHAKRETEFLIGALSVPEGAALLDVPCGGGRLSQPLAERGYRLTAVDWSVDFLDHARSRDTSRLVAWERRDMRDLPWRSRFDGAFCVGNSFGYLDDEGNAAFLRAVAASLKPGCRFILDTPMVIESLLGKLQERAWWKAGDVYMLVVNHYDHTRSRLDIEYTFVSNGRTETRRGTHRAYSYRELVQLMEAAGFTVEPARPWSREAASAALVATRRD